MSTDLHREFLNVETQITEELLMKCPISLVLMEIQI